VISGAATTAKETPVTTPTAIDPSRTALLVMDYQPALLASYPDASKLIERTSRALARSRAAGVKIVYVRVAFTAQDYKAIPSHNKAFAGLAGGGGGFLADGTPDAAIHSELAPAPGDVVVTKTRFGAFSTSNLTNFLNPRNIDNLILAGISTGGVVLSTLRDAADGDYRMFVLSDCCADPSPEVHRVLIEQVFPNQADVLDSDELTALIG
jgi:nicotinamidase-related amidase